MDWLGMIFNRRSTSANQKMSWAYIKEPLCFWIKPMVLDFKAHLKLTKSRAQNQSYPKKKTANFRLQFRVGESYGPWISMFSMFLLEMELHQGESRFGISVCVGHWKDISGVAPSTFQLVQFELNMLNVLGENIIFPSFARYILLFRPAPSYSQIL